jgi:type IV pilus assembly protein PilC
MATFVYTARDRDGNKTVGSVTAKDSIEARTTLRYKDLFVTDIREKAERADSQASAGSFRKKKVKLQEMVVMSRQLSTLVRAGISIIECLHAVAEQAENATLQAALREVRTEVLSGSTLADAMRKQPTVFNEKYISLVQAGETGGVLEATLEVAADQFDKEADLREKVKGAFVYPALVFFASVAVVTFMLLFIVPVFAKVYEQVHATLPLVTLTLVTVSDIILHYWLFVLGGLWLMVFAIRKYIKTPAGRLVYDKVCLKLPIVGKLNRKIAVARFTQTLAGAVQAGVPIIRALMISANTSGNLVIVNAVVHVTNLIKEGSTLAAPLEATGQFPIMVTRMIAAGEQSGNLDEMLGEITKFFNRDIEYAVAKLTRIMEPLMTIVVGGIVLFVLLALYMPIFNLSNVIKR